ncbi:MAG: tRNA pseudouridine(55) synthase TruB [Patescibacteria group bacterium]
MKFDLENIILVDKPKGITSFQVIRIMREKLGIKKIGHAGTLDPLATGLMILGIDKGTKKLEQFLKLDKTYVATVLIGKKTSTGDLYSNSEIIEEKELNNNDFDFIKNNIQKTLSELVGKINLKVPVYSAIKINGKKLCNRAFKGQKVEAPIREMTIYYIKLLNQYSDNNNYILEIEVKVSSGTYIRSIAEEIGNRLNLPATIKELRRISIDEISVNDALIIS